MFGYGFDTFGTVQRWWKAFNQSSNMYEVGAFFLSHKMVVRRIKNKRGRRK